MMGVMIFMGGFGMGKIFIICIIVVFWRVMGKKIGLVVFIGRVV